MLCVCAERSLISKLFCTNVRESRERKSNLRRESRVRVIDAYVNADNASVRRKRMSRRRFSRMQRVIEDSHARFDELKQKRKAIHVVLRIKSAPIRRVSTRLPDRRPADGQDPRWRSRTGRCTRCTGGSMQPARRPGRSTCAATFGPSRDK